MECCQVSDEDDIEEEERNQTTQLHPDSLGSGFRFSFGFRV